MLELRPHRLVCETHPDRPFKMFSKRADACECRGAGVPCPVCNTGEPTYVPPEFKAMLDDTGPRHQILRSGVATARTRG